MIAKLFFLVVVLIIFALVAILLKVFKVRVKSYRVVYSIIFGTLFIVGLFFVLRSESKMKEEARINNDIVKIVICNKNIESDYYGCSTKTFDFIENINRGQKDKSEYANLLKEKYNILVKEWEDFYGEEFDYDKIKKKYKYR